MGLRVLCVSSSVTAGYVGNNAMVFPLQRLGHEVVAVPTVLFSNHTGHRGWRGRTLPPDEIAELITGLDEQGLLAGIDLVISGYLGDPGTAAVVAGAVDRIRGHNPHAVFACDPVLGNRASGRYVRDGLAEAVSELLVPRADLITPNHFELDLLTGRTARGRSTAAPASNALDAGSSTEVLDQARALLSVGPRIALVTSVERADASPGQVESVAVSAEEAWLAAAPLVDVPGHGAGDLTTALFSAHVVGGMTLRAALAATTAAVWRVLSAPPREPGELPLIAAQDALVGRGDPGHPDEGNPGAGHLDADHTDSAHLDTAHLTAGPVSVRPLPSRAW